MKPMKKIPILILSVLMVFFLTGNALSALSTQTTTNVSYISVDKSAAGTKLSGTLTIYYTNPQFGENTDMLVFLRLRKGNNLYGFATQITNVLYAVSEGAIEAQQDALEDWVEAEVIPELYCPEDDIVPSYEEGVPPTCSSALPSFAIKSVDQSVEDDQNQNFNTALMSYTIMDVVIAVQD